jgi:hypothetical protein
MGYYIFSCGIKTDKVKSVFGCKDPNILESVKESESFDNYKDFLPEGMKTTPEKAVENIINGDQYDTKSNFAYGYAVICICKSFGDELPYTQEIKLGYETDFINKFLKESFGVKDCVLEEIMFADNSNPFDIPKIDDWPLIGLLTNSDLKKLMEKLKSIEITDEEILELENGEGEDDEEKGFAYQHIKGVIENIDYCIQNNLDMISFCH